MSDEIKEILDNTLEYLEGIDETRNTKILTTNETNILLDYITNLQEENEKLKKPDYYEKGLIGSIKERDEIIQDYKSRCEEAIEFIEGTGYGTDFSMNEDEVDSVLNILKGIDKE